MRVSDKLRFIERQDVILRIPGLVRALKCALQEQVRAQIVGIVRYCHAEIPLGRSYIAAIVLGRSRKACVFRGCEQFGGQFAEEGARPGSLVAVCMRKGQPGQLYGVAIVRNEAAERFDDIVPSLFEVEEMREHRAMAEVRGIGDELPCSLNHTLQSFRTAVAEGIGYRDVHRQ